MPAKGFKVITVHERVYEDIKRLAESEKCTVPKIIEELVRHYSSRPTPPPLIGENPADKPKQTIWDWPGPYVRVVTAPQVERYCSTAFILSEEYPDVVGRPQSDPAILERITRAYRKEEKFSVEKVLIISPEAWTKKPVWNWVSEWCIMNFVYGDVVKVFVVLQKELEEKKKKEPDFKDIDSKYYDMGIYGKELVAFLNLGKDYALKPRVGIQYLWDFDPDHISEAQKIFEKLKKCAITRGEVMKRLTSLQAQESE